MRVHRKVAVKVRCRQLFANTVAELLLRSNATARLVAIVHASFSRNLHLLIRAQNFSLFSRETDYHAAAFVKIQRVR